MRKFLNFILVAIVAVLVPVTLLAQTSEPVEETNWLVVILGAIVAVFDIVARSIPNAKWKGIIGLLIDLLKRVSDWLNNKG